MTADADLSAEKGSGSTPRKGAGSIATDAAERPRPARIWVSRPPNECPITAGFLSSLPITSAKWSATWPMVLPAKASGCSAASSTVWGSSGQPGVSATKPEASKSSAQRFQLLGSSQRPWTKTTGVWPDDALARSTCSSSSCSSMFVRLTSVLDPVMGFSSLDVQCPLARQPTCHVRNVVRVERPPPLDGRERQAAYNERRRQ